MTDLESLSRRLQTLEGRFRRIKILALIACIGIAALVLMGQAPLPGPRLRPPTRQVDELPAQSRQTVEHEVRTHHIILLDDKGTVRQTATLNVGIDDPKSRELNKFIKGLGIKGVSSQTQGDQLRVQSKKRDDLQQVIAALKGEDFGIPLQFKNFRD